MADQNQIEAEESLLKKYGEPIHYDPEFHGPVRSRSCTDVLCLILFVAFLIGWIVVAVFASLNGNPSRLLYPTDSRGQVCGQDEPVKDKPYLFFFDLTRCASPKVPFTGCPTSQVCVKECPKENWFYTPTSDDKSKLICKDDVDVNTKSLNRLVLDYDCAAYYVHSRSIARRCIPVLTSGIEVVQDKNGRTVSTVDGTPVRSDTLIKSVKVLATFLQSQQVAEGVVEDIKALWPYMLLGCLIAMVVSFIWILLLRFIAKIMVWLSLVLFTGLCGYGAYYTLNKYLKVRNNMEAMDVGGAEKEFSLSLSKTSHIETTWLVFFIITISVFTICLLVLIFLRKRVQLAVALIQEASKAVRSVVSTLFFPIIPYVLNIIFLIMFCIVTLLLVSAGTPHYKVMCTGDCSCSPLPENSTCNPNTFSAPGCANQEVKCNFFSYEKDPHIQRLHIYNIFALFWTMCFVSAFGEMVLAGAFSSWYWAFKKPEDVPATPVLDSFLRTLRYHIGTVAFGSLIIAIVRLIRVIFEYIDHQFKKYSDSTVVKVFSCLCKCCMWCLEKFLRFINRNAYIYCAIYGNNFCQSARKSFSLIMRNVIRVMILDKVTDFLLFIGKLVVTGSMALLAFFFFSGEIIDVRDRLPEMNYYLTPVIIITIGTFFIASAFFDVYNMAVDTLVLCFLEDEERNDGSPEKPYFMSKKLMKILDKSDKLKEE